MSLWAPWQIEMQQQGMALLYPDRSSVQYVLAEAADKRPCLRVLLFLRDERQQSGQGWLQEAETLLVELDCNRFFEYWLLLIRHQTDPGPFFERLARGLSRDSLAAALRFLRSAFLAQTLQVPSEMFYAGLLESAGQDQGSPIRQFHRWAPLLIGCLDLGWESGPLWDRVDSLVERLAESNRQHFCEIYGYLATRLGQTARPGHYLSQVKPDSPLREYVRGGKAPSSGPSLLRNYRREYAAERKREFVLDILVEHPGPSA